MRRHQHKPVAAAPLSRLWGVSFLVFCIGIMALCLAAAYTLLHPHQPSQAHRHGQHESHSLHQQQPQRHEPHAAAGVAAAPPRVSAEVLAADAAAADAAGDAAAAAEAAAAAASAAAAQPEVIPPPAQQLRSHAKAQLQQAGAQRRGLPAVVPAPPLPAAPALQQPAPVAGMAPRPAWATELLSASPEVRFTRIDSDRLPGLPAPFWVAVEDSFHSTEAILQGEMDVVGFFLASLATWRTRHTGATCHMLDIGANGGFYALLARSLNCRTLAIEPQPRCCERIQSAAALNGFAQPDFTTVWGAVGEPQQQQQQQGGGAPATISVGATRCSGLWGVKGSGWINAESSRNSTVGVVRLADATAGWLGEGERVALLKIDVEGSEVEVLRSALHLLEAQRVDYVAMEVAPSRTHEVSSAEATEDTLRRLYGAGYQCVYGSSNGVSVSLEKMLVHFERGPNKRPSSIPWVANFFCQLG